MKTLYLVHRGLRVLCMTLVFSVIGATSALAGIEQLGIDPRGRSDLSLDIPFRCYADDALENGRPYGPHPLDVAFEAARLKAIQSASDADAARAALAVAKVNFESSFTVTKTYTADDVLKWYGYVAALSAIRDITETAYRGGLILLAPDKTVTWSDIVENPDAAIRELATEYLESLPDSIGFSLTEGVPFGLDQIVKDIVKAGLLEKLKTYRDSALSEYDAAVAKGAPSLAAETRFPSPTALAAYDVAKAALDAAVATAIADGQAAFEAQKAAEDAPSDLPACDSNELKQLLATTFCPPFDNPFTLEEEAENPGITARFYAKVAEIRGLVCGFQITSGGGAANVFINVPEHETTIMTLVAGDPGQAASTATYAITGGVDQALFALAPSTGALSFKTGRDFESPADDDQDNRYEVTVTASDGTGGAAVQAIQVAVTDVAAEDPGVVILSVVTSPALAGDGTFGFASTAGGLDGISITTAGNTGVSPSVAIAEGVIVVVQNVAPGWRVDDIQCVGDTDAGTTFDVASRSATIDLDSGETITCTFTTVRDESYVITRTQRVISNFMVRRADQIAANAPDLSDRLSRRESGRTVGGPFSFNGSGADGDFRLAFSTSLTRLAGAARAADAERYAANAADLGPGRAPLGDQMGLTGVLAAAAASPSPAQEDGPAPRLDVWIDGKWAHVENRTRTSTIGIVSVGIDYLVNPDLVVGALVQIDNMEETDDSASTAAEGTGWTVGPYVVARLNRRLLFDGRLAWGRSDNSIKPLGTYSDRFSTDRWLASGQLTGDFRAGNWTVAPQVGVIYFQDSQKAYLDSLGNTIPDQTVSLGRLTFGPTVSRTFKRFDGTRIQPSFKLVGIWDFDRTEIVDLVSGLADGGGPLRARATIGLDVRTANNWVVRAETSYDGIGARDFSAYGASIRIAKSW